MPLTKKKKRKDVVLSFKKEEASIKFFVLGKEKSPRREKSSSQPEGIPPLRGTSPGGKGGEQAMIGEGLQRIELHRPL